jgi:hypothetical protein
MENEMNEALSGAKKIRVEQLYCRERDADMQSE